MDLIYKLLLHESMDIDMIWSVKRVPGGWLYVRKDPYIGSAYPMVFVPFNNEFMEKSDLKDLDDYTERLLLLAQNVLYTDKAAPAREGLPGQGTVRYWIIEWVLNKQKFMSFTEENLAPCGRG